MLQSPEQKTLGSLWFPTIQPSQNGEVQIKLRYCDSKQTIWATTEEDICSLFWLLHTYSNTHKHIYTHTNKQTYIHTQKADICF